MSESKDLPYPTMSVEDICALPVANFAESDAHLYLWVTNKYLEQGYRVAREWGFKPVTLLTWCKPPMGMGLGGAFVQTTEFMIFARRGRDIRMQRSDTSWWLWKRPTDDRGLKKNSMKPTESFEVIEQVSPGPYLEMFSRQRRDGWDAWGNEVESDVSMALNPLRDNVFLAGVDPDLLDKAFLSAQNQTS